MSIYFISLSIVIYVYYLLNITLLTLAKSTTIPIALNLLKIQINVIKEIPLDFCIGVPPLYPAAYNHTTSVQKLNHKLSIA